MKKNQMMLLKSISRRNFLLSTSLAFGSLATGGLTGCAKLMMETGNRMLRVPSGQNISSAASLLMPPTPAQLAAYPLFSWDRVPVAAHLGKASADFSGDELQFLADRFPLVTIEKMQGTGLYHAAEPGMYKALQQLKARNPRLKVLFYWNGLVAYRFYRAYETFQAHPTWALKNIDGTYALIRRKETIYDLSNPDCLDWWIRIASEAVNQHGFDGIFIDAVITLFNQAPEKRRQWGSRKYNDMEAGMRQLLKRTLDNIGDDKLLIFNGLRADSMIWEDCGLSLLQGMSGAMVEHFGFFSALNPDGSINKHRMAGDIATIQAAGRRGRILVVKGWPGFSWEDRASRSNEKNAAIARDAIKFPLACFLIAAEPYSYFVYSWGYTDADGTFIPYPEFEKPLGPPKGPAVRDGWIYTREFAHAGVQVDLELSQARIDWLP